MLSYFLSYAFVNLNFCSVTLHFSDVGWPAVCNCDILLTQTLQVS